MKQSQRSPDHTKNSLVDRDRVTIDFRKGVVSVGGGDSAPERTMPLDSPEAFDAVADAWLRAGWDGKYVYNFTWLGRPIIQLPDDMFTLQEVLHRVQPDVIVETGVAHGGSLVFHASLCKSMGKGRVIGIDIEIRPHNRVAIEQHSLSPLITLIEGDSAAPGTFTQVAGAIPQGQKVLVILDGKHTFEHVLAELRLYAPLVSRGSYIIAMDGIMGRLAGAPRSAADWDRNNPRRAAERFVAENPEFEIAMPEPAFNEGTSARRPTYGPGGFIRRIS